MVVEPWYFPFLGPVLSTRDLNDSLKRWRAKYGENFTLRLLGKDITIVGNRADLKTYYHATNEMLSLARASAAILGNVFPEGQYLTEYSAVPYLHKVLGPSFLRNMAANTERALVDYLNPRNGRFWIENGNEIVVDFFDFVYRLIIRMNCANLASERIYHDHVDEIIKLFTILDTEKHILNPLAASLKKLLRQETIRDVAWKRWIELLSPDIERYLKMIEDHTDSNEFDILFHTVEYAKDELQKRGQPFTPRLVAYFIYTAVFPAQLNTYATAALLFLRWMRHEHDHIGKQMREEIQQLAPLRGRLSLENLSSMNYIQACIYEVLRLGIDAQIFIRHAGQDVPLSDGRYVPAGNFVITSLYGSRDLYTNPSQFDPERHLPPREENKTDPYRILPFGRGRHPCPGEHYVKMQLKIMLVHLSQTCKMELMEESRNHEKTWDRTHYATLSRPSKPVYVKLSRREE